MDTLFYRLVLSCFAAGHTSYLVQFDGLHSVAGAEPLASSPRALGLSFAPWLGLSLPDAALLFSIVGAFASLLGAAVAHRGVHLAALILALGAHVSLMEAPSTFQNFQWDILLAEVGTVALLLCASNGASHARLLVRFTAFKLLFMSGVVKLQAGCATWERLTALEVHFASQPLPTPLAWAAHSLLPPIVSAVGVAATLWIECVGSALLLLPWRPAVALGAATNALLQLLIMLTGNYNYFNGLTLALLLPALAAPAACRPRACRAPAWVEPAALALLVAVTAAPLFSLTLRPAVVSVPATAAALAAAREGWAAAAAPGGGGGGDTVALLIPWWARVQLRVADALTSRGGALGPAVDAAVFAASAFAAAAWAAAGSALLLWEGARFVATVSGGKDASTPAPACARFARAAAAAPFRLAAAGARGALAVALLCATGVTLAASATALATLRSESLIVPALGLRARPFATRDGLRDAAAAARQGLIPPHWVQAYHLLQPLRAVSGYGLFRQMTGVGPDGVLDAWGAPVTTTARPELVLEGAWEGAPALAPRVFDAVWCAPAGACDGGAWREIPFPYKPNGGEREVPAWVLPHSPRLDWQMWFASFGENAASAPPWLLNAVSLILHGAPGVYALLVPPGSAAQGNAPAALGWPVVGILNGTAFAVPPSAVRVRKFALDLSRPLGQRASTPWVRHRHMPLKDFFADPLAGFAPPGLEGEGAPPPPAAAAANAALPPLRDAPWSAGVGDHPASAALRALLPRNGSSARSAADAPRRAWWQRHPIDDEGALWLPPVARSDRALAAALLRAGVPPFADALAGATKRAPRARPALRVAPARGEEARSDALNCSAVAAAAAAHARRALPRGSGGTDGLWALAVEAADGGARPARELLAAARGELAALLLRASAGAAPLAARAGCALLNAAAPRRGHAVVEGGRVVGVFVPASAHASFWLVPATALFAWLCVCAAWVVFCGGGRRWES
jgi:hypothetical protein